jgi:hypothetical protein
MKRFILLFYWKAMKTFFKPGRSRFFFLLIFVLISKVLAAQNPEVVMLTSGTKTSLRGLSVVNDNVIWVSGSHGTVGKSLNSGKNWNWMTVKGFEDKEFRISKLLTQIQRSSWPSTRQLIY